MTQTIPPLPPAFMSRMRSQLGTEADAYFAAMEQPYVRGLRLNPRKPVSPSVVEGLLSPIPWEPNGFELSLASKAGSHPLHEAGAYYLQEPSAMLPARVLSPKAGERVLDLCAAPGGKSTQLAGMLGESGLLVCNEPVLSRAQILSRNLERMGVGGALVVSADPSQLASQWPCAFDAVLVDAPCSGEGMFRRHPETRLEWRETSPAGCAVRQQRILESAISMLKPGGRLVYSTCTLSGEENEAVITALLSHHPELFPRDFSVETGNTGHQGALHSQQGMLRVYPHQLRGEGHFMALLGKEGNPQGTGAGRNESTVFSPPADRLAPSSKTMVQSYREFAGGQSLPMPNAMLGSALLCAPDLPPLKGIKTLRAGLHLGMLKGKVFAPDHALALALALPFPFHAVALSLEEAMSYQRGETLPMEGVPRGYTLVTHEGLALGFAKASDGQLKNHYPKGLRRPY